MQAKERAHLWHPHHLLWKGRSDYKMSACDYLVVSVLDLTRPPSGGTRTITPSELEVFCFGTCLGPKPGLGRPCDLSTTLQVLQSSGASRGSLHGAASLEVRKANFGALQREGLENRKSKALVHQNRTIAIASDFRVD